MPENSAAVAEPDAPETDAPAEEASPETPAAAAPESAVTEPEPATVTEPVTTVHLTTGQIRVGHTLQEVEDILAKGSEYVQLKRAAADHFITVAKQHVTHFFAQ